MERRFILTVDLSNLAIWFFFFLLLLGQGFSPFLLKEALRFALWHIPVTSWIALWGFVVGVHLLSHVQLFATLWIAALQAPLSFKSPRVCTNSFCLSQWCYLTISSSAFSFCPQYFPASGSFPMSQHFASDGQSVGASPSAIVLPMNNQGWFSLGLTNLISQDQGTLKSFLQH